MKKITLLILILLISVQLFAVIGHNNGYGNDNYAVLYPVEGDHVKDFIDKSIGGTGHTLTTVNDTTWSGTQTLYGKNTMYFDGTGDYLRVLNNADFSIATGIGTIDWWMYADGAGTSRRAFSTIGNEGASFDNANRYQFSVDGANQSYLEGKTAGVAWNTAAEPIDVSHNVWVHYAVVLDNASVKIYVNGNQVTDLSLATGGLVQSQYNFLLGGYSDDAGIRYCMNGYIGDFRFSKGIKRWDTNFKPPPMTF